MYDKNAILLGRGACCGACKLDHKIEYYVAESGTLYAKNYTEGDKTGAVGKTVAGYGEAMTRAAGVKAFYDRGEVTVVDEST